jgi:hypothetical protein
MSFTQYTKCVPIGAKKYPAWAPKPTSVLVVSSIAVLVATLIVPYLALIEIPLLITYCLWWLYDRLICLDGDVCAIGLLGGVEPPSEKKDFDKFDTDFSINLVLAPHSIQELPLGYPGGVPPPPSGANATEHYEKEFRKALHRQIADDGIQGHLIKEQDVTSSEKWEFEGYFNKVGGSSVLYHNQAYLHCEFEGGGVYKLLQALYVLAPVATALAIVLHPRPWLDCLRHSGGSRGDYRHRRRDQRAQRHRVTHRRGPEDRRHHRPAASRPRHLAGPGDVGVRLGPRGLERGAPDQGLPACRQRDVPRRRQGGLGQRDR